MPRRSVDAKPFVRFANDDPIVAQNPRRIVLEPEPRRRRFSCARLSDEEIAAAVDEDAASMQLDADSVAEDRCDEELVEWIRERIAVSRDVICEHDFAARECVVEARDFVWIGCKRWRAEREDVAVAMSPESPHATGIEEEIRVVRRARIAARHLVQHGQGFHAENLAHRAGRSEPVVDVAHRFLRRERL